MSIVITDFKKRLAQLSPNLSVDDALASDDLSWWDAELDTNSAAKQQILLQLADFFKLDEFSVLDENSALKYKHRYNERNNTS